eukprot:scaffold471_cov372-Pavlova_lutheri.AAC.2
MMVVCKPADMLGMAFIRSRGWLPHSLVLCLILPIVGRSDRDLFAPVKQQATPMSTWEEDAPPDRGSIKHKVDFH